MLSLLKYQTINAAQKVKKCLDTCILTSVDIYFCCRRLYLDYISPVYEEGENKKLEC